jgi:integrase
MSILLECPYCHRKQSLRNKICICGADLDKLKKQKEKVKYWVSYYIAGKQKREVVGFSIEEARDAEGKRRSQKRENRIFDIKQDSKMTFKELSAWYLNLETVKALSSYWLLQLCLKKFNTVFGDMIIRDVKSSDLKNYQTKRQKQGLSDATIDQEIGTAKTMIHKAFDDDMISGNTLKTFRVVKKLLKKNSNARDRILTPKEFSGLLEHSPRHLKGILSTAYFTGMRQAEVLNLTWDKVDLKRGIIQLEAADTKDKEKRNIPICNKLHEVLNSIPQAIHSKYVFLYKGKPVKDIRNGLKETCKKAGIIYGRFIKNGFVFHDLRHTFNTNMRKAGVAESVIMNITGHATREMFDRYNKIDLEDTQKGVNQMEMFLKSIDQTIDQAAIK